MAGGIAAFFINKGAGMLFDYAAAQGQVFTFLGFYGKPAGYMIIFCYCAVAYILAWSFMKILVPKHQPIIPE
jgi:ACS family hexuronate transporter-like MFS transporter